MADDDETWSSEPFALVGPDSQLDAEGPTILAGDVHPSFPDVAPQPLVQTPTVVAPTPPIGIVPGAGALPATGWAVGRSSSTAPTAPTAQPVRGVAADLSGGGSGAEPAGNSARRRRRRWPFVVGVGVVGTAVAALILPRLLFVSGGDGSVGMLPAMTAAPVASWTDNGQGPESSVPLSGPLSDLILTTTGAKSPAAAVAVKERAGGRQVWSAAVPGLRACTVDGSATPSILCLKDGEVRTFDSRSGATRGAGATTGAPSMVVALPSGGWVTGELNAGAAGALRVNAYDHAGQHLWERSAQRLDGGTALTLSRIGNLIAATSTPPDGGWVAQGVWNLDGAPAPEIPSGSMVGTLAGPRLAVITPDKQAFLADLDGRRTTRLDDVDVFLLGWGTAQSGRLAHDGSLPLLVVGDTKGAMWARYTAEAGGFAIDGAPLGMCGGTLYALRHDPTGFLVGLDGKGKETFREPWVEGEGALIGTLCDGTRLVVARRSSGGVDLTARDGAQKSWTTQVALPPGSTVLSVAGLRNVGILVTSASKKDDAVVGVQRTLLTP